MANASTTVTTPDDVELHVECFGIGIPMLFIHEFAGDHRSWAPQIRHFARSHMAITYGARGYPPSQVPDDPAAYSQQHGIDDALAVLDGLGLERAHVVGLSMGGFVAAHLARLHPDRVISAVVAGAGYGASPDTRHAFQRESEAIAHAFEQQGSIEVASRYAFGPARVQFEDKDPQGHAEFATQLGEHDALGAALTMRGFQKQRPSLYDFADQWREVRVPMLIMTGDEDEGCLEPDIWLKRTIPSAGLAVLPWSGHTLNLEEPALFNQFVERFIAQVEAGTHRLRNPRSLATSTTGMDD